MGWSDSSGFNRCCEACGARMTRTASVAGFRRVREKLLLVDWAGCAFLKASILYARGLGDMFKEAIASHAQELRALQELQHCRMAAVQHQFEDQLDSMATEFVECVHRVTTFVAFGCRHIPGIRDSLHASVASSCRGHSFA